MSAPVSLTEEEVRQRARSLEPYAAFDGDGILGFLHAQAIGPAEIPSLLWLPVLFDRLVGTDHATQEPHVAALMVLSSCVKDRLVQKVPLAPPERDDARWASFAAGFIAYAELDLTWRASTTSWNYALWAAVLAGRSDLLGPMTPRQLAMQVEGVQRALRTHKANTVVLAYEELRGKPVGPAPRGLTRVGRNDACPCGSGKKFKKCCVDKGSATPG